MVTAPVEAEIVIAVSVEVPLKTVNLGVMPEDCAAKYQDEFV
jgi:hypothetical protein